MFSQPTRFNSQNSRTRSLLGLTLILLLIVVMIGSQNGASASAAQVSSYPLDTLMGVTDQAGDRVLVMDIAVTDWNSPQALLWSWKPSLTNGFGNLTSAWGQPTSIRIRENDALGGGHWAVVTDSQGLAAIIPYPAGNSKKWGSDVGGNPQAAELMPDGNIAIAAQTDGWVRVYASSIDANSTTHASYALPGARGVLWDPHSNLLWAVGNQHLVALVVGGPRHAPTLTESYKVALPTATGRDVQPVYDDLNLLWVPTNSAVYQFDKTSRTFTTSYTNAATINQPNTRSLSSHPLTGQVSRTTPKAGCESAWCTDTIDFYNPSESRTITGAAIYKAQYLSYDYQYVQPIPTEADRLLGATDQASKKILMFDMQDTDWNDSGSVLWEWAPTAANGFTGLTSAWGLPNEVRIRENRVFGGKWMVVTDSYGLAAIVPYPAGNSKKWALNVGGNPHAAELLPNGNIAVAASSGNWVRIYTSSQGPDANHYVEYELAGAHAALWDPENEVLWSVGDYHLVALKIRGTDEQPTIQEHLKLELPPEYKEGVLRDMPAGHDLQPVYGNTDRLWITTGMHVYQYVKSTQTFDLSYPGHADISREAVKSIGNQQSGQVVLTQPDYKKTPPGGCVLNGWCMESADLANPTDIRTRSGAAFYKVRVLNENYQ